jgi:hypothetical protein
LGGEPPGTIEQILLILLGRLKGLKALSNNHVAGGTGAAHFAGMFNLNAMAEQGATEVVAGGGSETGSLGTEVDMRKNANGGHDEIGFG